MARRRCCNCSAASTGPTQGAVHFDGQNLTAMSEAKVTRLRAEHIGFVFQTFNLIPTLTAAENVEIAPAPLKVSGSRRRARAMEALERVGLADRAKHVPSELSGGQQQRVGIARALVKEPHVLLADEPTGNLNEDTRDEIVGLLEETWRDRGLTLIVVTRDSTVARRAVHRGTMRKGRSAVTRGSRKTAGRPGDADVGWVHPTEREDDDREARQSDHRT